MNFIWIVLGLIGAVVLFLVLNGVGGSVLGLPNSQFAEITLLAMWGALIAAAVIPRQGSLKSAARNAVLWLLAILVLMAAYPYVAPYLR